MNPHAAHESADDAVTALALKAGRGDRAALTDFIQATQKDVWRLLAHLGGQDIADDLTQETYLRVMSALPRFAARSSARTWILSLARRVWVDNIRHDMARPRKAATQPEAIEARTPSSSTWTEWVDARLLIDALPPERREALILTQILGYTYEEAAKITGVRIGTIRSRVARARADVIAALTITMFLLGVRLYEAGVFNLEATSLRKKLLLIGAVALPIDLALGIAGNTGLVLLERYVVAPFTAMGLLALIIEACQRLGTTNLAGQLLQNVGRTALSCYLLQNLLGGILFYGWGFGLVNHVQSWRIPATMLGYIVIASAVVMFANLWLRRFSTGPVEWLWKKMAQL